MDTLLERKNLNFEVEKAFISSAEYATRIMSYKQTDRGCAPIDLYEKFYEQFYYLVLLTSDLQQMKQSAKEVADALEWLDAKINTNDDKVVLNRAHTGIIAFRAYKKVLSAQGVITLPSR